MTRTSPHSAFSLWSAARNRYLAGSCTLLLGLIGCDDSGAADEPEGTTGAETTGELPAGHPATGDATAADPHAGMEGMEGMAAGTLFKGVIKETMDAGGYTYVNLVTCDEQLWFAAPEVDVEVGQIVEVPDGSVMSGFESRTLGRTFDWIRFTSYVKVINEDLPCIDELKGEIGEIRPPSDSPAEKVEGELTVEQIFAMTADYAGKEITFRGEVVKYNEAIMGANWIHLQDGTGSADDKTNDLTITTSDTAEVGDKVVITGTLATDKDFGAGYLYAVIVENATVKAQ